MRTANSLKIVYVVALGVVTFFATNTILAQKARQKKPAVALPGAAVKTEASAVVAIPKTGVVNSSNSITVASHAMTDYSVELNGRELHIKAKAFVSDSRNHPFVWQVRIIDGKDLSDVFVHSYNEQMFTLPATNELKPTFEDIISLTLPAGNYAVETSLYRVAPEFGLDGMNDPEIAKFLRSPRGVRTFSLPE